MSVALIAVDSNNPTPPFEIDTVFIAKGLTTLPTASADQARLLICLAGSAEITVQAAQVEVFKLTTPGMGLLVDKGVDILSVGGPDNVATIVFSSARRAAVEQSISHSK